MSVAIGIDIGTTTVCCIAADTNNGEILKSSTLPNDAFIPCDNTFEKLQDADKIIAKVLSLAEEYYNEFSSIVSIGITCQMHGILYIDKDGKCISPLYTWQDSRGDIRLGAETYAKSFSKSCGTDDASGYGLVTHYYNLKNGIVKPNAYKIATIGDYAAMVLCGTCEPLMHKSNGASLGGFDISKGQFKTEALKELGFDISILPKVTGENATVGYYKGIPVAVAIGDNQASFMGSLKSDDMLLINIGTGSQVSLITDKTKSTNQCEIRPLYSDKYIAVGACLCGGRAYGLLHDFFAKVGKELFGTENEKLYDAMAALTKEECEITVDTRFSGTRKEPDIRGMISGIGTDNFTPSALITGTLFGMVNELEELYSQLKSLSATKCNKIVGSGNGIRLNRPICKMIEKRFNMHLLIPKHKEEAAFGAVIFSLAAAGIYDSIEAAQRNLINYLD